MDHAPYATEQQIEEMRNITNKTPTPIGKLPHVPLEFLVKIGILFVTKRLLFSDQESLDKFKKLFVESVNFVKIETDKLIPTKDT